MITMKNIAEEVGASQSTVSFVLNGKHKELNISEETCRKIKDKAREMGYYRNSIAAAMVTGKSNVIAYFSGNLLQEHIGRLIYGINMEANKNGFFTKLFNYDINNFADSVKTMLEQRPCGIICRLQNSDPDFYKLLKKESLRNLIPLVFLGKPEEKETAGLFVYTDDSKGTAEAVRYLFQKGHRHIGYLGFSRENDARYLGYKSMLEKTGLNLNKDFIFDMGSEEKFFSLPAANRPTALVSSTDSWAVEFFKIAYRKGINIPKDVSLVGFGDVPFAERCVVPLTTIRQPFVEMGKELTGMLCSEIDSSVKKSFKTLIRKTVKLELIERDSVASVVNKEDD
jgi:DNA-binding LacI/PurR family transcriptional regulator